MQVHGIKVFYNRKFNSVFYPPDWDVEYNVGEMLLDVYEFNIEKIKRIIEECKVFDDKVNEDEFEEAILYIMEKLESIDSVVIKSALLCSFRSSYFIYMLALEEGQDSALDIDTINKLLEICLEEFVAEYDDFKWFFEAVIANMNEEATEEQKEIFSAIKRMFREGHTAQSFAYEIITDPDTDEFMSVYTVNSLLSLLVFEYSHLIENSILIKRCKNCGRYFMPEKRSDTIYCQWTSPQDKTRTCRQIGAQIAMQNRFHVDETAKAYRKKYQSLNMAYQREIDDALKKRHFEKREKFKTLGQQKKKELKAGNITTEEFIVWCVHYL